MKRPKRGRRKRGAGVGASTGPRRAPAPGAIRAQPLTLGGGPDASDPAGRMLFVEMLMPGVAQYVEEMERDGFARQDWVVALLDPRRNDARRQVEQRPGGRELVARVMMELADNRPSACILAIPQTDFVLWLRKQWPSEEKTALHEVPLDPDQIYFAAFFKNHITHGIVRLPSPPRSPFLA